MPILQGSSSMSGFLTHTTNVDLGNIMQEENQSCEQNFCFPYFNNRTQGCKKTQLSYKGSDSFRQSTNLAIFYNHCFSKVHLCLLDIITVRMTATNPKSEPPRWNHSWRSSDTFIVATIAMAGMTSRSWL